MSDPRATFWYLNDVPGEFISPWTWRQTRGVTPYLTTFYASDDRFERLRNPVTLTIGAPDATMSGSSIVTFENLFLLEKQRSLKGLREYTLADVRWLMLTGSFTGSFNIKSYKNRYRPDSVAGDQPFTRQRAIRVAIGELITSISAREGRVILPSPQITFDLADNSPLLEKLPDNLGNSDGGGWVGAALNEFMPALLGDGADLVPARNGHLRIVDKSAQVVNGIDTGLILLDGILERKEVRWQKPKRCTVQFEQRFGDSFTVINDQPALQNWIVGRDPRNMALENVIPRYVADGLLADSGVSVSQYQTMEEFLSDPEVTPTGVSADTIRKRFLAPLLIDRTNIASAIEKQRAEVVETNIRAAWRRWWRVRDEDEGANVRRKYADIQLGVIKADGTTDTVSVICDYTKHYRFQQSPDDGALSRNVYDAHSPFQAYWHNHDDLVIGIDLTTVPTSLHTIYLGTLVEDLRLPTTAELLDFLQGSPLFECQGEFAQQFTMRVYYHGLWVCADDPTYKRLYEVTYPLFDDGEIDTVTSLYRGTTANWFRDHSQQEFRLLNPEAIYLAAADRTAQIKKSYEQYRAGDVAFGGVDVLSRTGIEPVGDLYDLAVKIGSSSHSFEIGTTLSFRPYVAAEIPFPELLESLIPQKVG